MLAASDPQPRAGEDTERVTAAPVLDLPGVCDSHVHVFGPTGTFGYVPDRRYTPPDALIGDYTGVMRSVGIARAVLTAPSVHGLDNRALLHGLAEGGDAFRGIVMVTSDVDDETLRAYHEAGVRGIRTQLTPSGGGPLRIGELRALSGRIAPLGWHVEIHVDVGQITDIDRRCAGFAVPVAIEHMGHMPAHHGVAAPGFQALLRLLRDGGWVKLSGAYINSETAAPHEDVRPFVDALLDAAPSRAVWGTNWPHPHQSVVPDDRSLAETIVRWIDDPTLRRDVLADSPARLYDFDRATV